MSSRCSRSSTALICLRSAPLSSPAPRPSSGTTILFASHTWVCSWVCSRDGHLPPRSDHQRPPARRRAGLARARAQPDLRGDRRRLDRLCRHRDVRHVCHLFPLCPVRRAAAPRLPDRDRGYGRVRRHGSPAHHCPGSQLAAAQPAAVDRRRIYLVTSAIGGALAGLAACLLAMQYDVHPFIGNTFGPVIFMICVLGGLGNMIGGFIASFIISQIIAIGGYYSNSELSYVLAFTLFIVLMFVRPRGLFAR